MRTGRLLMVLGSLTLSASLLTAQAPPPGLVTIKGTVVDDAKAPVASALLGLELTGRTPYSARSGADGRFEFVGVPLTTGSITVRRLGFRAQTVTLDLKKIGAGEPLVFALETVATEVDPVTVESSGGKMAEFYDRKAQSKFGHFFDRGDIERINPRVVSELFRTMSASMGRCS